MTQNIPVNSCSFRKGLFTISGLNVALVHCSRKQNGLFAMRAEKKKKKVPDFFKPCHLYRVSGAEVAGELDEKADHILLHPVSLFHPISLLCPIWAFADFDSALLSGCQSPPAPISHLASDLNAIQT